ncbi:MAG: PEGA domain-containing protein [Candidatus Subteraquimicrobiales bacterium]|nr:PEGA domain-containing protein [Candidatus Subteraquimicrobiales bacterium]
MIKRIIFFVLLLTTLSYPFCVFPQEKKPLNLTDIEKLLRSGVVSNAVIIKLITKRGVSFIVTEDVTNKLRDIGADNTLIKTIKKASGGQYPQSRQSGFAREKIEELSEKKGVIKVMQITGEIIAVDAKSNTLKVKGKKGDVIIIYDDKTKIMAGNEKKAFEDIEISDKVTVKYTENDGKNVAKSIAIKQAVKKDKNRDERVEDKSEKKNGWISIMSYPKGIVFINGKEIGYTPLKNKEIPVGQNEISVRANDNEQKRVVIVRENETVEVSFQFDKAY